MENRAKTRLSRIFQGSLSSCRTKHLLDVAENAVLIPPNDRPPSHASSNNVVVKPKPKPLPSLCKPRHYGREKTKPGYDVASSIVPRRNLYFLLAEEGFKCPPASPLPPLSDPFYSSLPKKKKSNKKKERKRSQEANSLVFRSYSQDSAYYNNWFSSDEEEGKEQEEENDSVFFSSRSNTISSDSSSGNNMGASKRHPPRKGRRRRRTTTSTSGSSSRSMHNIDIEKNHSTSHHKGKKVNMKPLIGDQGPSDQSSVKDSFAVVKSSSDPRNDFMTSMVEMIIEKQIFGDEELEHLLQCFLSLNYDHHHGIIVEVFEEICEALFSS